MDKQLIQQFHHWLNSPKGRALVYQEKAKTAPVIANTFGYLALQIGLPDIDYLANHCTREKLILSSVEPISLTHNPPYIKVPENHIPFDDQSVDLLVLPHTLELNPNPELLIKEANRVLIHEGMLVITGFNPWHLSMIRYLYHPKGIPPIPYQRLISMQKIKDWFTLHGFEMEPCYQHANVFCCDGVFYIFTARKRSIGMHLINPALPKKSKAGVLHAAVTRQANKHEY